jgi:hypothetical protein
MTETDWQYYRESKRQNAELRHFQDEAQRTIDPLELQQWAVTQLNTHSNRYWFRMDELPDYLKLADGPVGTSIWHHGETNKWIELTWGSERKHFGILAGDTNYVRDETIHERLTAWKPGMYFYCETGI